MEPPRKKDYMLEVEEKIKQWNRRIDALEAAAQATTGESREKLLAEVAEIHMLQAVGERHLASVKATAKMSWDTASLQWRGTGRRGP